VFGLIILFLNKTLFDGGYQTILRITYDEPMRHLAWRWFKGPLLAAVIGSTLQIWKLSLFSAVAIAFSWQTLATKLRQTIQAQTEPVQPSAEAPEEGS
jgi:hypothetical protein